jgi:predicted transcriptional regulator
MVAPTYSENRREMAKKIGLGRKPKQDGAAESAPATPKRGRGRKAEAAEQA